MLALDSIVLIISAILLRILAKQLRRPDDPDEKARDVRHGAGEQFLRRWRDESESLMWVLIIFGVSFVVAFVGEVTYLAEGEGKYVPIALPVTYAFVDFAAIGLLVFIYHRGMRVSNKEKEYRRVMHTENLVSGTD